MVRYPMMALLQIFHSVCR